MARRFNSQGKPTLLSYSQPFLAAAATGVSKQRGNKRGSGSFAGIPGVTVAGGWPKLSLALVQRPIRR
jgi:hypothetical protein